MEEILFHLDLKKIRYEISDHIYMALLEDKDTFRGITLFEELTARNSPDIDLANDNE